MNNKILIVIDMQNDFIDGVLGNSETRSKNLLVNITNKINTYKNTGNAKSILFTRDTHDENYMKSHEGKCLPVKHCIKGTNGWEIIPELKKYIDDDTCVIDKKSFGYDNWKNILESKFDMKNVESIELIGVCTDICVVSNALLLRALYPEMKINVDLTCCAGVTPERHIAAGEVMKSCHINVLE